MLKFFTTDVGKLRAVSFVEGVSLLALVGIGMPLKYLGQDPSAVKILGPVHGVLFLLFMVSYLYVGYQYRPPVKTWALVFLGSLLPFGTFVVDKMILSKLED